MQKCQSLLISYMMHFHIHIREKLLQSAVVALTQLSQYCLEVLRKAALHYRWSTVTKDTRLQYVTRICVIVLLDGRGLAGNRLGHTRLYKSLLLAYLGLCKISRRRMARHRVTGRFPIQLHQLLFIIKNYLWYLVELRQV